MAGRSGRQMLAAGAEAPEFRLPDVDGGEHSLAGLISGGPVVLVFYKGTCPVCQLTLPFLERLQGGKVRVVAISQDNAKATREFWQRYGLTFPVLLDEAAAGYEVSNRFGISTVPSLFEVHTDGRIAHAWQSWSKADVEALARRAERAVFASGEQVPAFRPG